jgi:hypothetical protein
VSKRKVNPYGDFSYCLLTVSVEGADVLAAGGLVASVEVADGLQTALAGLLDQGALRRQVVVGGAPGHMISNAQHFIKMPCGYACRNLMVTFGKPLVNIHFNRTH